MGTSGRYSVSDVNFGREKSKDVKNNDVVKHKETQLTFCGNLTRYLCEYADVTGVQGFRYLSEKNRSFVERIFWAIIIAISIYFSVVLIIGTYVKWDNSPVLVSFATSQTPIWKIPFPAITICPESKFRREMFNFTDVLTRIKRGEATTEEELRSFDYSSMVCNPFLKVDKKLLSKTVNDSALDFLSKVSPGLQHSRLAWAGHLYKNASDLFTPILTSEGICYTFNLQDRSEVFSDDVIVYDNCFSTGGKLSDWSLDEGYPDQAEIADVYPKRTMLNGKTGGLELILHVSADDLDYACGNGLQGFKVTLHNPGEIPRVKQRYFRVALGASVVAGIKPNMMTTSEELRDYPPEKRQCFFAGEKKLQLFKGYNQANCLIECLTDYTLGHCGCVGFHMARVNGTPVCGAANQKCINDAKVKFLEDEIKFKVRNLDGKLPVPEQIEKCNCLPACNALDFEKDVSQSSWNYDEYAKIMKSVGEWKQDTGSNSTKQYVSKISVFFKEMQFITSQRNELYGKIDFLANIGGIIGLFTGCSFITLFELLYYITLRIICNLWNHGWHNWSGSQNV